jgi:NTP pyrophosphatase (non-canonical NTP hydrolase)
MIVKEEILDAVLLKWGAEAQVDMLHEEIGELMSALNKHKRGRVERTYVQEEIADCLIMLQQMRHYFGKGEVDMWIKVKTKRLEERLADPDRRVL